jgi:hypothetical protein
MTPLSYVADVSMAGMLARTPGMPIDAIRVGPKTHMGVS